MDAKPVAINLVCRVCGSQLESEFQQIRQSADQIVLVATAR